MSDFSDKLKNYLHDPIDKPFDIPAHIERARKYAELLDVSWEDIKGPDQIATCMERSLLPEGIIQNFDEIRHPFSDEKIKEDFISWKEEVFMVAQEVFQEISKVIHSEDKLKFLYLWRNLQDEFIKRSLSKEWRKYIPLFPADTRIPDHSIWEHLKITTAIKAFENLQNNSLFLLSIGPVQSFISQARKTQDLFMGSFLLSYLTFVAMERIIEEYGPTNIIYPDLYKQPLIDWWLEQNEIDVKDSHSNFIDQPTIPNRFVAIIPICDEEKIREVAKSIEGKVKNHWKEIVEKVLEDFKIDTNNAGYRTLIEKQTKNFPEIYWVALPLKLDDKDIAIDVLRDFFESVENFEKLWKFAESEGEFSPNIGLLYQLAYTALEKCMGARKNLRDFEKTEEEGKKCHLCGERKGWIKKGIGNLRVGRYIGDTEGLCALCFVKRGLDKYLEKKFDYMFRNFSFPSTAEVAVADYKELCLERAFDELKEYQGEFKSVVGENNYETLLVKPLPKLKNLNIENLEGEWFFEENLTKKQFEKQLGKEDLSDEEINRLRSTLKKLYDKIGKPNPYYAVIKLDADYMGRWLSGEKLPDIEHAYNSELWQKLPEEFKKKLKEITNKKLLTPAIHASISTALRNYSIEFVRKIVEEEHLGKLVYAGGDDVLCFVNLKDLFEVLRKLRASFSGHIKIENGKIEVDWGNNTGFVEKDGVYLLTMGKEATASCGVVIAHYKEPLKIVLGKVNEMEKKAKEQDGKDSFAICLMKHSGQQKTSISKWRYENFDVVEKLQEFARHLEKKDNGPWLSKRFIYNLADYLKKLKNERGYFNVAAPIFDAELKRALKRSIHGSDKREEKQKILKEIYESLTQIFTNTGMYVDNFINLLEICALTVKEEE